MAIKTGIDNTGESSGSQVSLKVGDMPGSNKVGAEDNGGADSQMAGVYQNPAFQPDSAPASGPSQQSNGRVSPDRLEIGKIPLDEVSQTSHVDNLKEERRNQKPLWFCKVITTYPKTAFGLTTALHLLMVIITAILFKMDYDILPIEFDQLPLDIRDDVDYLRGLAYTNRDQSPMIIKQGSREEALQAERSAFGEFVLFFFEVNIPNGNIYTKKNLEIMAEVENAYYTNTIFETKFCMKDKDDAAGGCMKTKSILRYFDGTYSDIDPVFDDPNFENIPAVLYAANTRNDTKEEFQYHLGTNTNITETSATSDITKSHILLGLPLKGFDNATHNEDEQTKLIEEFMLNEFSPLGESYFNKDLGEVDFFYFGISLLMVSITKQVFMDMSLVMGSLAFIVIFMCLQTQSFWVTGLSIFSIMTGFCTANLIYRVVLDFRYLGIFHVMSIFIILGIGADDVFIFFDTWKASQSHHYPSLAHRLSDVYRKASVAMLFTSLTTAIAFIISAASPFLAISSFGVFAGLLIAVNYISVIIFFPTVVVTYHLYWDKYKCCCCCERDPELQDQPGTSTATKAKWKHPVVRFFRGPYYKLVTHKVARWLILVLFAAILAVFIYFATEVEVNEEQTKFLPENSNFGKALSAMANKFGGYVVTPVMLAWGLKSQDLSTCHKTKADCVGTTVYDETFNLDSPESQIALMDLCKRLKNLPKSETDKLHIKRNIVTNKPEVQCFLEDLEIFLQEESTRDYPNIITGVAGPRYPNGTVLGFPVGRHEAETIMASMANTPFNVYNMSLLDNPNFNKYLEIVTSYWLINGFIGTLDTQFDIYGKRLGEAKNPPYTMAWNIPGTEVQFYYGTKMAYATIIVNTTMNQATLGYIKGLPVRELWEEYITNEISQLPEGLKGGFQCTPDPLDEDFNLWHWLKVQRKLVSSAILGVIVGICCALPILIFATHNIVTGFLATLIIGCIVVVIIGIIPIAGWKIGMLESLNLVLVVGLAVDYVVHLAEGYSRSEHVDRLGRLHDTLEEVGISVLSGAVTTLGAAFFMLFAQIMFFQEFGVFLFCTIGCSILMALGLFITLLGIIGPQGDFGSLKPFYRWCHQKCCKCC